MGQDPDGCSASKGRSWLPRVGPWAVAMDPMAHTGSLQVYADASLVFPLLVAKTFAQKADAFTAEKNED